MTQACRAQQNQFREPSDMTKNKLIKFNKTPININGKWATTDGAFVANVSKEILSLHSGEVRIRVEAFVIKFEKLSYKGKNIASKIKDTIGLGTSYTDDTFTTRYEDKITNSTISLTIKIIDKNNIQFYVRPVLLGNSKNGTVFPTELNHYGLKVHRFD